MTPVIDMSCCMNAELQHEIDAIETARKWREFCKKKRENEDDNRIRNAEKNRMGDMGRWN